MLTDCTTGPDSGGNNRARTCDPMLVRHVLSQLSYAPLRPSEWRSLISDGSYYTRRPPFCQALFSKRFERFELGSLQVSRIKPELLGVYWFFSFASQLGLQKSFFCLSAWRSSIIPYTRPFGNPFFQLFCPFFSVRPFYQFFAWNLHLL